MMIMIMILPVQGRLKGVSPNRKWEKGEMLELDWAAKKTFSSLFEENIEDNSLVSQGLQKKVHQMLNKNIFWKEDKVILEWQCPGSPTSQPYWWSEPVGQKRNCLLCPTWWHTLTRIFPDITREDVFSIRKLTNAVFRMINPIIKDQNVAAKRAYSEKIKDGPDKTSKPVRLKKCHIKQYSQNVFLTKRLRRSWQIVFLTKRLLTQKFPFLA